MEIPFYPPDDDADAIAVPRAVLQVAFDAAVNSLSFTSGFLDDEEVDALRAVAVLLGVDPVTATPANHMCRIEGKHDRTYV